MKRYFLSLVLLFSKFFSYSQSNIYHPFPDSNAIWSWQWSGPSYFNIFWYCLKGDTVINSITYHKLNICDSNETTLSVQGGIRQDISNKKIYFYCFNSNYPPASFSCNINNERLLYDFQAGIGDTVFYSINNSYNTVISIDSIQLLDGTYRKKFNILNTVSGQCYFPIIEGIGSEAQLLWGDYGGGANLYELLCFKQNNVSLYTAPPNNNCPVPTAIQENNLNNYHIYFTPNPTSGILNLRLKENTYRNLQDPLREIFIYNDMGQLIYQQKNNSTIHQIDFSAQPKGIYFIKVQSVDKIYTEKVVLQ